MTCKNKAHRRAYIRDWVQKRRRPYFAHMKCVVCGTRRDLQLDHVNAKRKIQHKIWSWKEKRRDREYAKCWTLCRDHHIEKSRIEKYLMPYKKHRADGAHHIGVYKRVNNGITWAARIQILRKRIWIGTYNTERQAVLARNAVVKREVIRSPFHAIFKNRI